MATVVLAIGATALASNIGAGIAATAALQFGAAMLGGYFDSKVLFRKKLPGVPEGPRLEEVSNTTSGYGIPVYELFGTMKFAGNIIWCAPIEERHVGQEWHYFSTLAIGICRGPIDGLMRVWANDKLLGDLRLEKGQLAIPPAAGAAWPDILTYRLHLGTETQTPDPSIVEDRQASDEEVPAFRGLAYFVVEDFPLSFSGGVIPNFTFEVSKSALEEVGFASLAEVLTAPENLAQWAQTTAGDRIVTGNKENLTDGDLGTGVTPTKGFTTVLGWNLAVLADATPFANIGPTVGAVEMLNDGLIHEYVRVGNATTHGELGYTWDDELPVVRINYIQVRMPGTGTATKVSVWLLVSSSWMEVASNFLLFPGKWNNYFFFPHVDCNGIKIVFEEEILRTDGVLEVSEFRVYNRRVEEAYAGVIFSEDTYYDRIRVYSALTYSPLTVIVEVYDGRKWQSPHAGYSMDLVTGQWAYWYFPTGEEAKGVRGVRISGCMDQDIRELQVFDGEPSADEFIGPEDFIVLHADNHYVTIQGHGQWNRLSLSGNRVEAHRSSTVFPDADGDFDVDENDVIYTSRSTTTPGMSKLLKMDARGFSLIAQAPYTIPTPTWIKVSRNPLKPWVAMVGLDGSLYIMNRNTMRWRGAYYLKIDPPVGTLYRAVTIESSGIVSAVASKPTSPGTTYVLILTPNPDGWSERTHYDVTSNLAYGETITMDYDSGTLLVGSRTPSEKIGFFTSFAESAYVYLGAATHGVMPTYPRSAWKHGPDKGYFTFAHEFAGVIHRINIREMAIERSWATDSSAGVWSGGNVYISSGDSIIVGIEGEEYAYVRIYLRRYVASPVSVADVIGEICERAGLSASEYDVTDVSGTIWGYVLDNRMRARDAIDPLLGAYFIDGLESGGKIKFVTRGGSSEVTLSKDDLAAHVSGSDSPQTLMTARQKSVELPSIVEIQYIDYESGYQRGVQRHQRSSVALGSEPLPINVPIAMTKDEARQLAEKTMASIWMSRTRYRFSTHRGYSYLDPADLITIPVQDGTSLVRIEDARNFGPTVEIEVVEDDPEVYTSDAIGIPLPDYVEIGAFQGPTRVVIIDCPPLSGDETTPGVYVSAQGYMDAWRGARIRLARIPNNPYAWTTWVDITEDGILGRAVTALPDTPDPWVWDEGNYVDVRLTDPDDTLSAATKGQVYDGANIAAVGREIIGFRAAELLSNGNWRLTGLLRGRRGTDGDISDHLPGEPFAIMTADMRSFMKLQSDDIDKMLYFDGATSMMLQGNRPTYEFFCELRSVKPLPVVHIKGNRPNEGNQNLVVTWQRRARYGGEWEDNVDVPLCEEVEEYQVDVIVAGVVVRTIKVPQYYADDPRSLSYTEDEQTEDGIGPGDPVTIGIYQISAVVGRGFAAEATV